jgi:hypothetical protein
MSKVRRRIFLVLGLIALGGGCNPFLLPFYLTATTPKVPAEYHKLADEDKKKDVKVVILTYAGLETRPEFQQADREIARLTALHLQKQAKENEEKLTVVNPLKVEEYKASHPDWNDSHLDLPAIGKHFKADYVIYMEIGALSMYQPGSSGTFYRGQANLTISLVKVDSPDDFTLAPKEFTYSYPPEAQGGNRAVDGDTPPQMFRTEFLNSLARRLAWQFTERTTQDGYMKE